MNSLKLDKDKIWHEVLESMKVLVSPAIFSTWLSQTHLVSLKKVSEKRYQAVVGCISTYIKATIEQRYFGLIQDSLIKTLNFPCDLQFTIQENPKKIISAEIGPLFNEENKNDLYLSRLVVLRIRPNFTFENFAVSSTNQMAWAAAQAVADKPGIAYNPLFIWGGVGVGKTHLMHAIASHVLKRDIDTKILICTAEEFVNDIVEGIKNKTTQNVRNKYRKIKVLFIDDIQFIAGKDTVQEEFFHTFNAVTGSGGQIVLTSDKHPSEIAKLEARLKSRFEAGLIVDISPPDFELKCAIIQIKSQEKGSELTSDLVQMIAANLEGARPIEGFLTRLFSEAKLKNIEINQDLVKNLLGKIHGVTNESEKKQVSVDRVIEVVLSHFSVSKRAILSNSRTRLIVRPRQILMYLLRTEVGLPLDEVGRLIGGRDHTTVMHAVETITRLASADKKIREDLLGIKSNF